MFSIGKNFTSPTVKVDTKERKVEYHPRTYTQFIQGLKNRELPSVVIRPNKNIAVFRNDMLGQGRCNSFDCSVSFD